VATETGNLKCSVVMGPRVEPKYPEHEKMAKVQEKSQAIGEFIDWLEMNNRYICEYTGGRFGEYSPDRVPINRRLAEFFGIDLNIIEAEKKAMLAEIRQANENREKEQERERVLASPLSPLP
jgi:1-aminocyclopropane-1-carboxylate deaminase/D-cysteine desulfhydrase-like pyridoxal-dependent ACC family enzyme